MARVDRYRTRHQGWNVRHFHAWYRQEGGTRRYTGVQDWRQEAGEVEKAPGRGKHRQRRARAAWPGLLRHQVLAGNTKAFDPRKYFIAAIKAMKGICKDRYEAFGTAGNASKIRALSLDAMTGRYAKGELDPKVN